MADDTNPPTLSPPRDSVADAVIVVEANPKRRGRPPATPRVQRGSSDAQSSSGSRFDMSPLLRRIPTLTDSISTQQAQINSLATSVEKQTKSLGEVVQAIGQLKAVLQPPSHYSDEDNDSDSDSAEVHGDPALSLNALLDGMDSDEGPEHDPDAQETMQVVDELLAINSEPQEYGDAMPEKVAIAFKDIPPIEVSKESQDRLKQLYKVPENMKQLCVPRVNPPVWRALAPKERTADGKLQFIQQYITYSLVAHAGLTNTIMNLAKEKKISKEEVRALLAPLMDSSLAAGAAHRELSARRRLIVKAALPNLAPLCSKTTKVTEHLFGDNLDTELKTAVAASRLVKPPPFRGTNRFHPYSRKSRGGYKNTTGSLNSREDSSRSRGGSSPYRKKKDQATEKYSSSNKYQKYRQ